jgi:hypothetical protein
MRLCYSERKSALQAVPSIVKVSAWDGKDAVLATNEIPLDELMKDD